VDLPTPPLVEAKVTIFILLSSVPGPVHVLEPVVCYAVTYSLQPITYNLLPVVYRF